MEIINKIKEKYPNNNIIVINSNESDREQTTLRINDIIVTGNNIGIVEKDTEDSKCPNCLLNKTGCLRIDCFIYDTYVKPINKELE